MHWGLSKKFDCFIYNSRKFVRMNNMQVTFEIRHLHDLFTASGLTHHPPLSHRKRGEETVHASANLPPFTGGLRGVMRKS